MSDDELESFKRLNLVDFAVSRGYKQDDVESSVNSAVLRQGDDKVIIKRNDNGHWVYFSVRDDADRGSIVDFVEHRDGRNLGRIRIALRRYAGTCKPSSSYCPPSKPNTDHAQGQDEGCYKKSLAVWKAARWSPEPAYLLSRGLNRATLGDPRFADTFRVDKRGNVIFPHHDRIGMVGYEIRNDGFRAIGERTHKALWYSRNLRESTTIIVAESSIDALSHAQLHGGDHAYVALSGQPSALQRDLLTGLLAKAYERGVSVITGFDNDPSGDKYHEMLNLLSPVPLARLTPVNKDWNNDLVDRRFMIWRVRFADGRGCTLREPAPATRQTVWEYARTLTGATGLEAVA